MKVYVLIEYTGTSSACDGAVIHGVFSSLDAANAILGSFSKRERMYCSIEE